MADIENKVSKLLNTGDESISTENLFIEAIEELIKDEIKRHIKSKLDENEELKEEFRESVEMLMEAKAREGYAYAMLAKNSADLGYELIPPHLKEEMKDKLTEIFEEKMEEMMAEQE